MISYTLWSNIFIIRIIIIIVNKKLNSIFDTESKIIHLMGSNKYIITKIKCWPVFKQDPIILLNKEITNNTKQLMISTRLAK